MNTIKHAIFIFFFLIFAWWVSLSLTQQRVVLETQQRSNTLQAGLPEFQWNFEQKSDVVGSFQNQWQINQGKIEALSIHPKLSLNFSGSALDSRRNNILLIESENPMQGELKLEFKTDVDDEFFYYSPPITLQGTRQEIRLNMTWRGQSDSNKQIIKAPWGTAKAKVSSLVFHFSYIGDNFAIKSISLTGKHHTTVKQKLSIDCNGNVSEHLKNHAATNKNINGLEANKLGNRELILSETCALPSRYMWLQAHVKTQYPQSQFKIQKPKALLSGETHTVNQDYTQLWTLNILLYGLIGVGLIYVLKIRSLYPAQAEPAPEPWYKWLLKKILFQKLILPHYFLLSYGSVLIPTIFLTIIMALIHWPDLSVLASWPKYFLWAVIQQFVLGYVLAEKLFNDRINNIFLSSLFAGFVFALFHLPSVTLMFATFAAGCCWAFAWLLFQRFIPLALSHSILALMFYHTVPESYLYSAKILQWFWK